VINCTDCRSLLVDYERGELDAARDAAMHAHLHACDTCRADWQADLSMIESLRASTPDRDFPMAVLAGVRQAMHAEIAPSFLDRLRASLRPAIALPVAAAVIIVGGILNYRSATPPPTLTGIDYVREHVAQTAGLPSSDRAWSTYLLTSANAADNNSNAAASPHD
jgi:anti-sigma factor RsiW